MGIKMKKKYIRILFILLTSLIILSGCETKKDETTPTESEEGGTTTVRGLVVDASSGDPINQAIVNVTDGIIKEGGATSAAGTFSVSIDIDKNKELTVIISASNYSSDTTSVFGVIGESSDVPTTELKQESGTGQTPAGGPASIFLYGQSAASIGVTESGAIETAQIIFEVQDSAGVHIDLDNQQTVNFLLGSAPGGGEYLYPASVVTNALGRASVTLNTGTKAGVVQVIAEFDYEGSTIRSKPVLIAIHGGLPDASHFYVVSPKVNYPAYGVVGYDITFTAYLGDKYTNPVRVGTAAYFETTSGIIGGSAQTGDLGTASVTLLTEPFPDLNNSIYPNNGKGFFIVTARTANENYDPISTTILRLQSGFPIISELSPTTFTLADGGAQSFSFHLADQNDNPMSEDQSLAVSVINGDIEVAGDVSFRWPDTQQGFKSFSFTVSDSKPGEIKPQVVSVIINCTGPNGNTSRTITGTSQ
jgi:hypothetical protein